MAYLTKEHRDKISTGLMIQLVDEKKKETYSVWNTAENKFIKDGQLVDSNGKAHELKETKFIPATDFKTLFPGCNKNNKIERIVMINGEEVTYPMPKSVSDQIEVLIGVLKSQGISIEGVSFKVSKTGTGLGTRYTVVMGSSTPASTPSPQTQIAAPAVVVEEVVVDTPSETTAVNREPLVLDTTEQQLVDALKASATAAGIKYNFEQVKPNFDKYNIAEDRAKLIWMDNLQ